MTHAAPQSRHARPAFTLVELMISIALVVLLILGVNQVFLYTSQAVGTGQAINDAIRNGVSVQKTLGTDLAAAVPNGLDANSSAALVITSTSIYAFRSAADLAASRSGNPSLIDLDGDGIEGDAPGETISPFTFGNRNYRTDTLSFFARGKFPRQTGGIGTTGPFVANMSSDEAWVWYGHLQLPDNGSPAVYQPAGGALPAGTVPSPAVNPNNYFASQFVLGRAAILLRPQVPVMAGGGYAKADKTTPIYDSAANKAAQGFIPLSSYVLTGGNDDPSWPLSVSSATTSADGYTLAQSRYDLAAGTIPMLQQNLANWIRNVGSANSTNWWTATYYNHTFHCNPFVPKPLNPQAMAQALPYFVRGCSQFSVEFAGDFVTQNNVASDIIYSSATAGPDQIVPFTIKPTDGTYGDVIGRGSDGVLDFFVDKSADPSSPPSNPGLWQRHIRWYGMPRDDNADGVINGWGKVVNSSAAAVAARSNNDLLDVVPVRDVVGTTVHPEIAVAQLGLGTMAGYNGESFEHFPDPAQGADQKLSPGAGNNPVATSMTNYASVAPSGVPPTNSPAYTAAFGPFDPRVKLIRVTMTVDDPTGRLRDGQTYQYVFPVGSK